MKRDGLIRAWAVTGLSAAAASALLALVGLPSPLLFGTLAGGIGYAVLGGRRLALPAPCFAIGQGLVGVTIGSLVDASTLRALSHDLIAILGVCLATLLVSIGGGYALRAGRDMSVATGVFAMVAGGASGVTAIARDLGADERVVAVVQYLRVLLVLVAMPVITAVVFDPERSGAGDIGGEPAALGGTLYTVLSVGVGLLAAKAARLPAGALLGPLIAGVALSVSGWFDSAGVPDLLVNAGYVLVGLQVGLRFTRDSLRSIAAVLPRAVALIGVVIAACAGLAMILAALTGESTFDAYLATTPGGMYAVLATAIETGSNVTFVLGVQVMRLLVMLLAAPVLARVLKRWRR